MKFFFKNTLDRSPGLGLYNRYAFLRMPKISANSDIGTIYIDDVFVVGALLQQEMPQIVCEMRD